MENNPLTNFQPYQYLIIGLIILIVLFIIFREINCWYWKINERIKLMEENNRLLNLLLKSQPKISPSIKSQQTPKDSEISGAVSQLKDFIEKEKKRGVFGKSYRSEICKLLFDCCKSKENCFQLIEEYKLRYNINLIEDLKNPFASYAEPNEVIEVFIKFEIIKANS